MHRELRAPREYARNEFSRYSSGATPPGLDLQAEAELQRCLAELAEHGLIHSARDISDGGIAVALAKPAFAKDIGVRALSRKAS